MGRAILVFVVAALMVTVFAVVSSAQCAAPTVSCPQSYVQAPTCPAPCPAPCPTCPPLGEQKWTAELTSLPSVACPGASGKVDFQLNKEGTAVRYWVHVSNVSNVNGAQIRLAAPGSSACDVASAPVVATLYDGSARPGCTSGRLSRGNITACDLTGPLQGQPLSALVIALTNGTAIVTVSTQQNPCGEIAGLAAPTTGQTVACYTGPAAQCNLGLSAACQIACAPPCPTAVAPAPQVVCPAPACPTPTIACCPAPTTTAYAPVSACCPPATVACPPVAAVNLQPYWKANLTAMPPTCPSGASGTAEFRMGPGDSSMQYWVNGEKISRYSAVRIRLLPSPQSQCDLASAPVIATLHSQRARSDIYNGGLASGSISSCDLVGPLAGQPVSSLVQALNCGIAVVTVETAQNPCGEIAGVPENCTGRVAV